MKRRVDRELAESFRDGVDQRYGPNPSCWLAEHDDQPCSGPFERFHFIGRQRIRNALWPLLPEADRDRLIELAEWDDRNGGIASENHHRRFDGHMTPSLRISADVLPAHVLEFASDWGLELEIERKMPSTDRLRLESQREAATAAGRSSR